MPCQQDQLYAAENTIDHGELFESLEAVQAFVDEMRDKYPFWEKAYSHVERIEIKLEVARAGTQSAGYYPDDRVGIVALPMACPSLQFVIHEVAHVLSTARYGSRAHDPWMARCYLELTYIVRGPMAYFDLYSAFLAQGVDFDAEGLT